MLVKLKKNKVPIVHILIPPFPPLGFTIKIGFFSYYFFRKSRIDPQEFRNCPEINNSHISECEITVLSMEEWLQTQNNTISKFIISQEQKLNSSKQVNRWQKTTNTH